MPGGYFEIVRDERVTKDLEHCFFCDPSGWGEFSRLIQVALLFWQCRQCKRIFVIDKQGLVDY